MVQNEVFKILPVCPWSWPGPREQVATHASFKAGIKFPHATPYSWEGAKGRKSEITDTIKVS